MVKDIQTHQLLIKEEHKDCLYLLHFLQNLSSYIGEKASPDTWHNRIGHPHFRVLQNILNKYGLLVTHKISHLHCEGCRTSKSHKLPFSIYVHKSIKPLELIHSDVWGPAPILCHFGFSYYVIFTNDFSKYTWLFPLRRKSDVLTTFTKFKMKVENQLSAKIISFQSDWGGELQELTTYLKEHGIHHRISCPYTPEHNGSAERKHRHIIETALALLKNASLSENFWDEAVSTATFLINRMTTPILQKNHLMKFFSIYYLTTSYFEPLDASFILIFDLIHLTRLQDQNNVFFLAIVVFILVIDVYLYLHINSLSLEMLYLKNLSFHTRLHQLPQKFNLLAF